MDCSAPILIAGPTASGKSRLALELARRIGGAVINADSMQVYADLRILTARPGPDEEAGAPHLLYGHVDGGQAYSVGRFAADAKAAMAAARLQRKTPIFVGGTGLYFKALLDGLSPIPAIPEQVRRHWRAQADALGAAELHNVLSQRDPEMAARLESSDAQRIVRALEVLDATGRSLAEWQGRAGRPVIAPGAALMFVLEPPREVVQRRCDARFDAMMVAGALDEVRRLRGRELDSGLPILRALGVRPLLEHLAGRCSLSGAIERSKAETRQYAKRQSTWIKSNMRAWDHLLTQQTESLIDEILSKIDSRIDGATSRP